MSNPFGDAPAANNPFGAPAANDPFAAQPSMVGDPFGTPANAHNPFGDAPNPFGAPPAAAVPAVATPAQSEGRKAAAVIGGTNSAYGALSIPPSTRDPGIATDPNSYDNNDERYDNDALQLMSRAESQDLLADKPEGYFCVRLSGSEPDCVVITTTCNSQVIHLVLAKPLGGGLTHLSKHVGDDVEAALLTFRSKAPIITPDGTHFWLTVRIGPIYVPAAGPEKGSKEWKEAEKKRKKKEKEDEKKADKEQKAAQKRIKQAKKISKQAEKNGVAPPTLPDTPDGTISPGGTDYGEKFDSPQWGQTAPVDPFAAPSPSLPALPSLPAPGALPPLPPAPGVPATLPPLPQAPGVPSTLPPLPSVPAPGTSDPFGAPPSPAAGAVDPFGSPAPSTAATAGDPFGSPATPLSDPFGAPAAAAAPAAGSDPFGAPAAAAAPAAGSDPFGAPAAPAPAPGGGDDPFGAPAAAAAAAPVGSPFGGPAGGVDVPTPTLELSDSETPIYTQIWSDLCGGQQEIQADIVVPFLTKSKANLDTLKEIWEVCDVVEPLGQLTKLEFFNALKLVALSQAGMEPVLANIGLSTPPPSFETASEEVHEQAAAAAVPDAEAPAPAPAPAAAAPAPAAAAPAAAAVPPVCTKLAISVVDLEWYESLWEEAPTNGDSLPAGGALKYFTTSELAMSDLKMIWGASDTTAPKGQLNKEQFFGACKLIAVKQNGGALGPAAFALPLQPLPKLGSNDPPEAAEAAAQVAPAAAAAAAPAAAAASEEVPEVAAKLGLSADDLKVYEGFWSEAPTNGELLPAGGALKYFTTSGLGMPDLKMIWGASDRSAPKGQLSKEEFFGACKLIAVKQNGGALGPAAFALAGQPLPKLGGGGGGDAPAAPAATAPAPAAAAAGELSAIAKTLALSADDIAFYDSLWGKAPTDSGFLAAGGAVKFLGYSRLPMDDLKAIWSLSDKIAPKGKLCKDEFFAACKYVAIKQNGGDLTAAGVLATTMPLPKFG